MNVIPAWLHILSIAALVLGFASALFIAAHIIRRPQKMWIMNLVWPLTALFGTVLTAWAYLRFGRQRPQEEEEEEEEGKEAPFPVAVAKGALHCGSGCTLGDICAEWLAFAIPAIAVWLGWQSLFSEKMFAVWILDYAFAFLFGIAFQYFTIAPLRGLGPVEGLVVAVKADALSLTAWQVGMYGFMAVANLLLFRRLLGSKLEVASPEFWFMMQIAMICGFLTAYPVNWWLIRAGLKEKM